MVSEKQLELQIYPNPFTSIAFARFDLPQTGMVRVQVYDVNGRLVRSVFHGSMNRGRHEFKIDGSKWAPGVYHIEMILNEQRLVRKIVLSPK